jgi:hypothetical protein
MKVMQAHSKNISRNKINSNRPSPFDVIGNDFIRPLAESLTMDKFKYDPDFDSKHEPRKRLWEWKDPATGKPDDGVSEHEKYGTPLLLDQPETIAYFNNPYDEEAEIGMKRLLTTVARTPLYEETSDMTKKRKEVKCSPPFINSIGTLQVHPGASMDKRVNTSRANQLYLFPKVYLPIYLDHHRAPQLTAEIQPRFRQTCRAVVYWSRMNNNPSTTFRVPYAIRNEDCYKDVATAAVFRDQNLHMIAAALFITNAMDVCLDHPIQHKHCTSDTRCMAHLEYDEKNNRAKLKWLMTPSAALAETKARLNKLAAALSMINSTSELPIAKLYHQISEFI